MAQFLFSPGIQSLLNWTERGAVPSGRLSSPFNNMPVLLLALDHQHLRDLLQHRVNDGVLKKLINKWLKAGVMETGT